MNRALALDKPHYLRHRVLGRDRDHHVHLGGLQYLPNFYCLPGRAGGLPVVLAQAATVDPSATRSGYQVTLPAVQAGAPGPARADGCEQEKITFVDDATAVYLVQQQWD